MLVEDPMAHGHRTVEYHWVTWAQFRHTRMRDFGLTEPVAWNMWEELVKTCPTSFGECGHTLVLLKKQHREVTYASTDA